MHRKIHGDPPRRHCLHSLGTIYRLFHSVSRRLAFSLALLLLSCSPFSLFFFHHVSRIPLAPTIPASLNDFPAFCSDNVGSHSRFIVNQDHRSRDAPFTPRREHNGAWKSFEKLHHRGTTYGDYRKINSPAIYATSHSRPSVDPLRRYGSR